MEHVDDILASESRERTGSGQDKILLAKTYPQGATPSSGEGRAFQVPYTQDPSMKETTGQLGDYLIWLSLETPSGALQSV